jgi:hypothetical protein
MWCPNMVIVTSSDDTQNFQLKNRLSAWPLWCRSMDITVTHKLQLDVSDVRLQQVKSAIYFQYFKAGKQRYLPLFVTQS